MKQPARLGASSAIRMTVIFAAQRSVCVVLMIYDDRLLVAMHAQERRCDLMSGASEEKRIVVAISSSQ
jgi:hypothetical protein